jgi:hypothetical protein
MYGYFGYDDYDTGFSYKDRCARRAPRRGAARWR